LGELAIERRRLLVLREREAFGIAPTIVAGLPDPHALADNLRRAAESRCRIP
jgi:hypothetical protein